MVYFIGKPLFQMKLFWLNPFPGNVIQLLTEWVQKSIPVDGDRRDQLDAPRGTPVFVSFP